MFTIPWLGKPSESPVQTTVFSSLIWNALPPLENTYLGTANAIPTRQLQRREVILISRTRTKDEREFRSLQMEM